MVLPSDRLRRIGKLMAILAVALPAAACGSLPRTPYNATEAASAQVPGMAGVRYLGSDAANAFEGMVLRSAQTQGRLTYLALSGGGGDGAYGAGVLNGWTEAGTRPTFSIVSGVSTGALIAPFAFLGPKYDEVLRAIYTSGEAESLVQSPSFFNAIFGSGLFGNDRLRALVGRYVTSEFLAEVAAEHAKGRRLLVLTTNLDAQRAVLWDLGAIAASGQPNAATLFGDVLTASASIPAVFPPQLLTVEANGRSFQEMHVDGSVVTNIFTLPEYYLTRDPRLGRTKAELYVIMNGRLEPSFRVVANGTVPIVERSFTTASRSRSRQSLAGTYAIAHRNGIGFNLTYINPRQPEEPVGKGFDTGYMRSLYQSGFETARGGGDFWLHSLPTLPATVVAARP